MMNKLINILLSGLLWRRYKFLIVTLILLVVSILVTGKVHDDYVEFSKTAAQADYLGWSFILKWLVWMLLFVVFFISNNIYNKRKEREQILSENQGSILSRFMKQKGKQATKSSEKPSAGADDTDHLDPFADIRKKDKLRSYAQIVIDQHDEKSPKN